MQHIDLNAAKAAKATDRRALAILAFDNATADPAGANWRGVAELLRLALPASKAKAETTATESRFALWADYPIPHNAGGKRLGKSPVVIVTFADGETVRAPAVSLPGKPVNIGRALRVARSFYQGRMVARYNADLTAAGYLGNRWDSSDMRFSVADTDAVSHIRIPTVVSCICETTGAEYDPAACSEMLGAVPLEPAPVAVPAAAPVTADFVPARRFLASTSIVRDIPLSPVAPSKLTSTTRNLESVCLPIGTRSTIAAKRQSPLM